MKWAETTDGFLARENYTSKWISNELSRKIVHKWRSEEDAVLVGTNTILFDNPQLNVRDWIGRNPLRMALDLELKTPKSAHVLDGTQPTIIFNLHLTEVRDLVEYVKIDNTIDPIIQIIQKCYERNILSIMVEGGALLLKSFIKARIWDEARVFKSKKYFGKGLEAPILKARKIHKEQLLDDELIVYYNY